jgi:hypothetical protein
MNLTINFTTTLLVQLDTSIDKSYFFCWSLIDKKIVKNILYLKDMIVLFVKFSFFSFLDYQIRD